MHLDLKIQSYDVDTVWEGEIITTRSQTDFYPLNPMYPIIFNCGRIYKKNANKYLINISRQFIIK